MEFLSFFIFIDRRRPTDRDLPVYRYFRVTQRVVIERSGLRLVFNCFITIYGPIVDCSENIRSSIRNILTNFRSAPLDTHAILLRGYLHANVQTIIGHFQWQKRKYHKRVSSLKTAFNGQLLFFVIFSC